MFCISLVELGRNFFVEIGYHIMSLMMFSKHYNRVAIEHLKTHQNREAIESRESNPQSSFLVCEKILCK